MSKETLYATATTATGRLRVPVGEIETPDGTVFDTTMQPALAKPIPIKRARAFPNTPKLTNRQKVLSKRKKERQNKRKARA